MGTGASNQVGSRSHSASDAVCSLSGKETGHDNTFSPNTTNIVNKPSKTPANKNNETIKSQRTSQKSEIRSLPSPSLHVRNNSQETDNTFRNLSRHDLHQKIRDLESALAMSESHKLDLQDLVQTLEERCSATAEKYSPISTTITDTLHETLNCKDQQITKLEENLKNLQTEYHKKALKYRKRIRGLTKQIFELRQEMSITQMELKAQISQQNDLAENHLLITPVSNQDSGISHFETKSNSHTKIIVELSTQISEQEEQISRLTAEVAEKTQRIKKLETALKETRKSESTAHVLPSSRHSETSNRDAIATMKRELSNSGGQLESSSNNTMQISAFIHTRNGTSAYTKSNNNSHAGAHNKPALEHHSTALSDSDSDWGEGFCLPNVHRHSAPAESRLTRSLSKPISRNAKTKDMNFQNDDECSMNSLEELKNINLGQ